MINVRDTIIIKFIICGITAILLGCSSGNFSKNVTDKTIETGRGYVVSKIDSIGNYFLIFADTDNRSYKIVSEKNEEYTYNAIEPGRMYNFDLSIITHRHELPANHTELAPSNYLDIASCITFGDTTEICISGFTNLANAKNIKGLCYIKTYREK